MNVISTSITNILVGYYSNCISYPRNDNCNFIITSAVLAQVHANLARPEVESEIARRIASLTEEELDELNNQLETDGLKLVHVQLVDSILIWILCSTEDLFLELKKMLRNGRLAVVLTRLFITLIVTRFEDLRMKDLQVADIQFTSSGS